MKGTPDVSLVIPAYNEEDNIEEVVERVVLVFENTGLEYELVVVNDGSVDDTQRKAINCANNHSRVKVISYKENMGKGHALKTGFEHATGNFIVFMDSDLDIDPRQVRRYINALSYGDLVIASKWHPQSSVDMPLMRKLLSRSYNVLVRLLVGMNVKDTQTGLKASRREALERVFPMLAVKRYAFDAELLVAANQCGLTVVELPVNLKMSGRFRLREVWMMFKDLLGIAYRLRVRKWYTRT